MRGTGGPLLCIGDLLCDVGEEEAGEAKGSNETLKSLTSPSSSSASVSTLPLESESPDLPKLFQDNYDQLNKAFDDNDRSWTALTLKMCSALDTASKLVESTNSNSRFLLERVVEFEQILEKGDSTREAAMAIQTSYSSQVVQDSISSQNEEEISPTSVSSFVRQFCGTTIRSSYNVIALDSPPHRVVAS